MTRGPTWLVGAVPAGAILGVARLGVMCVHAFGQAAKSAGKKLEVGIDVYSFGNTGSFHPPFVNPMALPWVLNRAVSHSFCFTENQL